jgi:glycine/serine hydroxymethyltransferase
MGVSEMTRFGMYAEDFKILAGLISDVVLHNKNVIEPIKALRKQFCDLQYSFKDDEFSDLFERLHVLAG